MGATVGVLRHDSQQSSEHNSSYEERIHAVEDILRFDQTRRQFCRFMQSRRLDALVNFCLQLDSLLNHKDGNYSVFESKVQKMCFQFSTHEQIVSNDLTFSFPWAEEVNNMETLLECLRKIGNETKLYLAEYLEDFKISEVGASHGLLDTGVVKENSTTTTHLSMFSANVGLGSSSASSRGATPRNSGSALPTPASNSGSPLAQTPRQSGHTPRLSGSHSPPNSSLVVTLDAHLSDSSNGSPNSRGKSLSTFPDKFPKVLVADDSEPITRSLKKMFLDAKHPCVECATDGQQAVEIFRETPANIVLIDVLMPVLNGCDAIRLMRRIEDDNSDKCGGTMAAAETTSMSLASSSNDSPLLRRSRATSLTETRKCIIIAISGIDDDNTVEEVFEAGADAFLSKGDISLRSIAEIVTRQLNINSKLSSRDYW